MSVFKIALGSVLRIDADGPAEAASARKFRQSLERCERAAEAVEQGPEGCRPYVLRLDQTELMAPLLIVQLDRHTTPGCLSLF